MKSKPAFDEEPWEGSAPSRHPCQRIFMSIDAIGSTRIKTYFLEKRDPNLELPDAGYFFWIERLLGFLAETRVIYTKHFTRYIETCPNRETNKKCKNSSKKCDAPDVWKFIGDEIVLCAELKCPTQVHYNVQSLIDTLSELNKAQEEKPIGRQEKTEGEPPELAFKGAAWVGGFPTANIIADLPLSQDAHIEDYIGPSIDLGFRLSKNATKSRIAISASLAKLLHDISAKSLSNSDTHPLSIYSAGFSEFKGVKHGKHPVLWIATEYTDDLEKLLISPIDSKNLTRFFKKYFAPLEEPFILGENTITDSYRTRYRNTVDAHQLKLVATPG